MREAKRVLLECVVVAVVGVGIALVANAANPHGLILGRDYFLQQKTAGPGSSGGPTSTQTVSANATQPSSTQALAAQTDPTAAAADDVYAGLPDEVVKKLRHFDLQPIRHEALAKLFNDPWYSQGLYVIVDARDEKDYEAGHIPGAYHIYYWERERYLPEAMGPVAGAEKIITYCNGGDCEDSVLTAAVLRDEQHVDPSKLFVYPGGFQEWQTLGLPVERGLRGSNDIVGGAK